MKPSKDTAASIASTSTTVEAGTGSRDSSPTP